VISQFFAAFFVLRLLGQESSQRQLCPGDESLLFFRSFPDSLVLSGFDPESVPFMTIGSGDLVYPDHASCLRYELDCPFLVPLHLSSGRKTQLTFF